MKMKFDSYQKTFTSIGVMIVLLIALNTGARAQTTGEVINLGLYGGAAVDLTYCNTNQRLFGAVNTPASLFYTDDDGATWTQAFQVDSLEYAGTQRGWGGGGVRVLANSKGWVTLRTTQQGGTLTAAVVSYTQGDSGTFHTAMDNDILHQINPAYNPQSVTGMGLSDHYQYIGLEQFLVRINDTSTYGPHNVVTRTDTITGIGTNYRILDMAVANQSTGYPVFLIAGASWNEGGSLYKFDGSAFSLLTVAAFPHRVERIFTHPAHFAGDTLVASIKNTSTNVRFVYLSVDAGVTWTNITPSYGTNWPLHSADYSASWIGSMPVSDGFRLSFPGGGVSDDLGATWTAHVLPDNAMATHPTNLMKVFGAYGLGVAMSTTGPAGSFSITDNIGLAATSITKIAESTGVYYVSTNAGLGYTNAYFNDAVTGIDRWRAPYGDFPITGVGNDAGVSAVALSPTNNLHVVAGHTDGFSVSTSGPTGFSNVVPTSWNASTNYDSRVNDIRFVSDEIVVAVTGSGSNVLQYPSSPYGNIWRSSDGGLSWSLVTPAGFLQGNSVEVAKANGDTVLYVGTGYYDQNYPVVDGKIWRSDDLGLNWSFVNNGPTGLMSGTANMPVYDIDVDPRHNDTIYVASGENLDYALAQSTDGGLTYTYTAIVPHGAFSSVLVSKRNPDAISVGARRNVFRLNTITGLIDTTFFGLPGEFVPDLENGSTLFGTSTGFYKLAENYGADTTRWNGTGNWNEPAMWSNGLPQYLKNCVIESGASLINEGFEVNELIVNPNTDLTLIAVGNLSMNATMTLKSDASGTASFINQKTGSGSFQARVENYLTDGKWHYVSPVINAATASAFYFAGGSQTWLKWFDEASNAWVYITDETQALEIGKGYAVWLNTSRANETTIYEGVLNKGNKLVPISYSALGQGWNLVGNPFPSALDWDLGTWNLQQTTGIAYVWNNGNYLTRNQVDGGTLINGIIPPGQAFFVQANGAEASVTMPEDACVHNHQPFYKEISTAYLNALDITVNLGDKTDKTWISFNENATEGMDVGMDAVRLTGAGEMPQLYTKLNDISLSINVLAALTTSKEVPLYFVAPETNEYVISFDLVESFENDTILLVDLITGIITDLKITSTYTFTGNPADSEYRFKLVFNPGVVSVNEPSAKDEIRPEVHVRQDHIVIDWRNKSGRNATIHVLDLAGRNLGTFSSNTSATFTLDTRTWAQQIVIVRIVTNNAGYNYKLYIE